MFLQIICREGMVGLHNFEQYLQVQGFRKTFSNFKKFRRGKNREITTFCDRKIYLG
jgi:hypothetical protein